MNADNTQLKIEYRALHVIKPLPGNTRQHDLEGIISSIREFGFVDPILISKNTFHDLDGNGRLEALRRMYAAGDNAPDRIIVKEEKAPGGDGKPVPVWYAPTMAVEFSLEDEAILALRLNRAHSRGGYDEKAVFSVLARAAEQNRLEQTGYEQALFDMLALRHAPPPEFEAPGYSPPSSSAPGANGTAAAPASASTPGAHSTTGPITPATTLPGQQTGASSPPPSHVRMVQLFLNSETQPVFYERTQALTESGKYLDDNDRPVNNLTDLIFFIVQEAYQTLKENEHLSLDEDDD